MYFKTNRVSKHISSYFCRNFSTNKLDFVIQFDHFKSSQKYLTTITRLSLLFGLSKHILTAVYLTQGRCPNQTALTDPDELPDPPPCTAGRPWKAVQGQKNVRQVTSLVTHLSASQLTNSNWLQVKVLSGAGAVTNPSRFKNEALSGPVITNREITWKLTLGPEAHLGDVALKKKNQTNQKTKQNTQPQNHK